MSRGFLLDTNVLSATSRSTPPPQVVEWMRARQSQLYTSSIAIAEISFGAQRLTPGRRRQALEEWLDRVIERMGDHILRFDTRTGVVWGKLQSNLEREAMKMPVEDSYMAAIALRHNLIVATQDTRDFRRSGVETVNPFESNG